MIKEFRVNFNQEDLSKIYEKVKNYPWSNISNFDHWQYGTSHSYLKKISNYWVTEFNWPQVQNKINSFSNFKTNVDGMNIHFIKEEGSGTNPKPLLLMHGWPGSIIEFLEIIKPLAHPEQFGGKIEDAITVIAPSLPGFGFSDTPPKPYGPRKIAEVLNKMMVKNLGYEKYVAQGGDWGATIANWIGHDHSNNCKAIHVNCLTMRLPDGTQNDEETKWLKKFDEDQVIQDGYRTQQATKPQTLAYAMTDSPVGIAAWILEKFHGWSDLKNGDIESVYSKDTLLANIMIYILTNSFNSASWIYYGRREEGGRYFSKDFKKINIPTGIAKFPKEMAEWPPRSYLERMFNIQQFTEMNFGGHFAALENPQQLIDDIRLFLSKIKL